MTTAPARGQRQTKSRPSRPCWRSCSRCTPRSSPLDEVVRELTDRPDDFAPRDRVNNAVRDLVAAGLVHRHGAFVFASRAAVRFEELRI